MECSWSLWVAQRNAEEECACDPLLGRSVRASDVGAPMVFQPGQPDRRYHYVYVDNIGVLAGSRAWVILAKKKIYCKFSG